MTQIHSHSLPQVSEGLKPKAAQQPQTPAVSDKEATTPSSKEPSGILQKEPPQLTLLGKARQMLDFFSTEQKLQIPERVLDLQQLQTGAVEMAPGETFAVRVRHNPSTGYQWQSSSDNLAALGELERTPKGRKEGRSADLFFIFQAPQQGQASFSLTHARPDQPETQQVYPVTVKLDH